MNPQDYFVLGCKLFGVYFLFEAIPALVATILTFVRPEGLTDELKTIYLASTIATRIIPIAYIAAGLYLIRGGSGFYRFAYPDGGGYSDNLPDKFKVFLKLLGIYLIFTYFPTLLRTISSFLTYTHAPKFFTMFQEQQFTYVNAASSIWSVLFGIYLLRGGQFIVKIALQTLPNRIKQEEAEESN